MFEQPLEPDLNERIQAAERALHAAERDFGPQHEVVAETLEAYATLLRRVKSRTLEAVNVENRAHDIRKSHDPNAQRRTTGNPFQQKQQQRMCESCSEFVPEWAASCRKCQRDFHFAGFWIRVVARIIDSLLLGFVIGSTTTVGFIIMSVLIKDLPSETAGMIAIAYSGLSALFGLVVDWLYYALCEASPMQGTIGKMATGLKVVDKHGDRLTFLRATGRFFAKFLSGLILYGGYVMVAFTEKKQGLHDIMAETFVIHKE